MAEKHFSLVVRQTLFSIHVTSHTDQFSAHSFAESLILEPDRGITLLVYLYGQATTTPGDIGNREGAAELRYIESMTLALKGHFWSNQKTNGTIDVSLVSRKHAEDFDSAEEMSRE